MAITINGTSGIAGVDGSAGTPAVQGTDTNTGVFFPAADTAAIATGGSERMRIDSSGNVGIGTSSPDAKLEITVGDNGGINIEQSGASQTGYLTFRDSDGGLDGRVSYDHSTNAMRFTTATTEQVRIDSAGLFKFNSGYGSVATAYGCRAWVNFNGTGTVAIRGSGNVSSITDNDTGDYTVNFSNAMPDANYSGQVCIGTISASDGVGGGYTAATLIAASFRIRTLNASQSSAKDFNAIYVAVFR